MRILKVAPLASCPSSQPRKVIDDMRKTIALAVAAVALTGCGMLPGQPGGGGEERQPSSAQEREPQATTEAAPSGQEDTPPAQEDKVIATRTGGIATTGDGPARARADITALKRQGRTVTLNWTVTSLEGRVNLHNGLSTGPLDLTVSGVSLIDPVNAKRYRVARNGTGPDAECVCSRTQGNFLEKGNSAALYAVFAAPPPDVTKVNVEIPTFGVITDVPLS